VLTFLDPERDPLGTGYHIIQSKIALGSGGVFGKGFLNGTQSHLNFLPEKHTDFIFTMLSEEFGMIGAVFVIVINLIIIAYSFVFALRSASYYGKLLAIGLATSYFLYVIINIAMVLGLLPVAESMRWRITEARPSPRTYCLLPAVPARAFLCSR
jgi:rod shape determining protein RodA